MMRTTVLAAMIVAGSSFCLAQESGESAAREEATIRSNIAAYVQAFNAGDAGAVAAQWSDAGEWIAPSGDRFRGRPAIQKELTRYFGEGKTPHIEILHAKIRFLAPAVAVEKGAARVTRPGQSPETTNYVAVHVKRDGHWKLESVRETEAPSTPSNYAHLKPLAWMVGTWVDQDESGAIETKCSWTKNKNFLTRSFVVKAEGRVTMEGTQIVGWDPVNKQFRSWVFDSLGGYGEGTWTRKGPRWVIRTLHVLPNGEKASSINIITPVDRNAFRWESTGRQVGGELLPNIGPVTVVRRR